MRAVLLLAVLTAALTMSGCDDDSPTTPTPKGALRIVTGPVGLAHQWTLTGPSEFSRTGGADTIFNSLDVGTYRVAWAPVAGWFAPTDLDRSLTEGDTTEFEGIYTPDPEARGQLTIDADPDFLDPAWTLTGPLQLEIAGRGDTLLTDMRPGDYELVWSEIPEWTRPPDEFLTLFSFAHRQLVGSYRLDPQHSYDLIIDTDPDSLSIAWVLKVDMGEGHFDSTGVGDAVIEGLPLVGQTIDWLDIPDWLPPDPEVTTLLPQAGQELTAVGAYTPRPSLQLMEVLVAAGSFMMGSPEDEPGHDADEGPLHQVTLTRDIHVSTTEITQGMWNALMPENPSSHQAGDNQPVDRVTWLEALEFCNALSSAEGLNQAYTIGTAVTWNLDANGYRLPTEAEWEYACRAGAGTALAIGDPEGTACEFDSKLTAIGWYCYNVGAGGTPQPVACLMPNSWGLYDMHGNVMEWCWDFYAADSYVPDPVIDPTGPVSGGRHVVRGGGYGTFIEQCRSASRLGLSSSPWERPLGVGFRVVRNAS